MFCLYEKDLTSNSNFNFKSISMVYPELAKHWHILKNGGKYPKQISINSSKSYWWTFEDIEFTMMTIEEACMKLGLIEEKKEDPEKKKDEIPLPSSKSLFTRGFETSYGERLMYSLLKKYNIDFVREREFSWSQSRRYDFYLPKNKTIIEVHGSQHYYESGMGRPLEEEQVNDELKRSLAERNGIQFYIVIDMRNSSLSEFTQEVENSDLMKLITTDSIDWEVVNNNSMSSFRRKLYSIWNNGERDIDIIKKELGLSTFTILKYLEEMESVLNVPFSREFYSQREYFKILKVNDRHQILEEISGAEVLAKKYGKSYHFAKSILNKLDLFDGFHYAYKGDYRLYMQFGVKYDRNLMTICDSINIFQYTKEDSFVNAWQNLDHVGWRRSKNFNEDRLYKSENGVIYRGYRWFTKSNLENLIQNRFSEKNIEEKYNEKSIFQIDINKKKIVNKWVSINDIPSKFNTRNITTCCKSKIDRVQSGGFAWLYKEDYDKMTGAQFKEYIENLIGRTKAKPAVKLDRNSILICAYESVKIAADKNSAFQSAISDCCLGKRKSTGGFKWMYKEDYEKMIQEKLTHEEFLGKHYPKKKKAS